MSDAQPIGDLGQARRRARGREALGAADALRRGDEGPACALLARNGWRFAADPVLTSRLLLHLLQALPRPSPRALGAGLAEAVSESGEGSDWLRRERLEASLVDSAGAPRDSLAWALEAMAFIGSAIEQRDRRPWLDRRYAEDAEGDTAAQALWSAWAADTGWAIRDAWEARYSRDGGEAFLALAPNRPNLRADFVDAFFFVCVDGAPPGWRRIHARVLESGPAGPIASLLEHVPAGLWPSLAEAMVTRGTRAQTARIALPEHADFRLRVAAVAERCLADANGFEALLDFHVAVRLIEAWQRPDATGLEASWRVVTQNRGRARGRLRAVMAALPTPPPLPRVGLDARTRYAIRRFCRDWARDQKHRGFSLGDATAVDPPCALDEGLAPYTREQQHMLWSWVTLAVLRGHLERLERWVHGVKGDGHTSFHRLLAHYLPEQLRVRRKGDRSGLGRVRGELLHTLSDLLAELHPLLLEVGDLRPPGRAGQLDAMLVPRWHLAVPRPRGRINDCVAHAARAARVLTRRGMDR